MWMSPSWEAARPGRVVQHSAPGRAAHSAHRAGEFSAGKSLRRLFEPDLLAGAGAAWGGGRSARGAARKIVERSISSRVDGTIVSAPLPDGRTRRLRSSAVCFDQILLRRARVVRRGSAPRRNVAFRSAQAGDWTDRDRSFGECAAGVLVAADGRNSTVARLCGSDAAQRARTGSRCRPICRCRADFGDRIVLQLLRRRLFRPGAGWRRFAQPLSGQSPNDLAAVKRWAERSLRIPPDHDWRTIAPLARAALPAGHAWIVPGRRCCARG